MGVCGALIYDHKKPSLVAQIPNHRITEVIAQSGGLLWTVGSGKATIVLAHDEIGKQDGFYEIDLRTGQSTKLLEKGQCYSCVSQEPHVAISGDGRRCSLLGRGCRALLRFVVERFDFWPSSGD